MDTFSLGDWTETCRLDEQKLCERLFGDERLPVLQRYFMACLYCLHVHIPHLWERLSQEGKQPEEGTYLCSSIERFADLWTYYMDERYDGFPFRKNNVWKFVMKYAVLYGNRATLMSSWKRLTVCSKQEIVIDLALQCVQMWSKFQYEDNWFKKFLSNELPWDPCDYNKIFIVPSDYSEFMRFFLSQMNEEQQLTFFKETFKRNSSFLECFVDWPYLDDFLPTINRLWGILPKNKFGECLLTLVSKYSEGDSGNHSLPSFVNKENQYYDYQSLLCELWKETPELYKRYLFCNKSHYKSNYSKIANSDGEIFLLLLLQRSPFEVKDERLFKQICCAMLKQEKITMMLSETGKCICSILVQKEKNSFMNSLLEECLSRKEILLFKKGFVSSYAITDSTAQLL